MSDRLREVMVRDRRSQEEELHLHEPDLEWQLRQAARDAHAGELPPEGPARLTNRVEHNIELAYSRADERGDDPGEDEDQ